MVHVQTQNGVNMASGTAITAPSTAPLLLTAGPSTIEPIVPIVAPLGAQDTPSVIQRARPVISTEQTMQSLEDMAPCHTAIYGCHACLSARLSYPVGYYGQGNKFLLMPNPNWMPVREEMLQHQLLQERQQFEAWRASQAQPQPQPQPPISSSGLPI